MHEKSQDLSTDYEFITHCTNWLKNNENYYPDIIVQLRPTQPCRKIETINECLDIFIKNYNEYDSLRSVVENEKSPYKMYTINNGSLVFGNEDKRGFTPLFSSIHKKGTKKAWRSVCARKKGGLKLSCGSGSGYFGRIRIRHSFLLIDPSIIKHLTNNTKNC